MKIENWKRGQKKLYADDLDPFPNKKPCVLRIFRALRKHRDSFRFTGLDHKEAPVLVK